MLNALIERLIPQRLCGDYPGTIARQWFDGKVDVVFDDPDLNGRGIGSIDLAFGTPSTTADLKEGQRVLVAFEKGLPSGRKIVGYEYQPTVKLRFGSDAKPVARNGDVVKVDHSGTSPLVGVVMPPHPLVAAAILAGMGSVTTLPPLTPVTLTTGLPVSASGKVLSQVKSVTA